MSLFLCGGGKHSYFKYITYIHLLAFTVNNEELQTHFAEESSKSNQNHKLKRKCNQVEKSNISSNLKATHLDEKSYTHDVLKVNIGEKLHKCDTCGNSYLFKSRLEVHERTHKRKKYKCNICQTNFSRSDTLKHHLFRHTGERPYKCDVCEKAFYQNRHLKDHKRTHTGERPYMCNICEKSFCQRAHLNDHKNLHIEQKLYRCDVCEKSFSVNSYLRKHKRRHEVEVQVV